MDANGCGEFFAINTGKLLFFNGPSYRHKAIVDGNVVITRLSPSRNLDF